MAGAVVRRDPEMTDILRVAISREQRIVGLITASDSGRVTATTAEGRKVVWKGRPDRLNDSTARIRGWDDTAARGSQQPRKTALNEVWLASVSRPDVLWSLIFCGSMLSSLLGSATHESVS
jgi:hypothetical protein